ncbi:hypothetical protein D3C75_446790 [compost metagenome]
MFLKFDPLITAICLTDGSNAIRVRSGYYGTEITVRINKDFSIQVKLNIHQKRMSISYSGISGKIIGDFFKQKHNIMSPKIQKHCSYDNYDFKYSSRNCHKIALMIRDAYIHFGEPS